MLYFFKNINLDSPVLWQTDFQNPATVVMESIILLHTYILMYLILVATVVAWFLLRSLFLFKFNPYVPSESTQFTHDPIIETVWTVAPVFVLVAIVVPSFSLLYSMDEVGDPAITVKVIGHQWYWSYELDVQRSDAIFDYNAARILFPYNDDSIQNMYRVDFDKWTQFKERIKFKTFREFDLYIGERRMNAALTVWEIIRSGRLASWVSYLEQLRGKANSWGVGWLLTLVENYALPFIVDRVSYDRPATEGDHPGRPGVVYDWLAGRYWHMRQLKYLKGLTLYGRIQTLAISNPLALQISAGKVRPIFLTAKADTNFIFGTSWRSWSRINHVYLTMHPRFIYEMDQAISESLASRHVDFRDHYWIPPTFSKTKRFFWDQDFQWCLVDRSSYTYKLHKNFPYWNTLFIFQLEVIDFDPNYDPEINRVYETEISGFSKPALLNLFRFTTKQHHFRSFQEWISPAIKYDSYMIPESDLKKGGLRLLEVDNRLILPIHTNVRLLITSTDVIHSWAVPSLGIKVDAIPGRLNQVTLNITRCGVFYGQCSELCGVNHSNMPIAVQGIKPLAFYDMYRFKQSNLSPSELLSTPDFQIKIE